MGKYKNNFKAWQWHIIVVSMIVYAMFYLVRKNFSLAMPGLSAEYGISNTQFGTIIAIASLLYGASRFINGFIVEKVSTRFWMGLGLVLCAAANFGFAFSADLSYYITGVHEGPQFVNMLVLIIGITILLNQFFQGMGYPPCARMLPSWIAPGELATKMSIWNTSHSIGACAAVILCGLIMSNMGADMSGDSSVVARIADNLANTIKGWEEIPYAEQQAKIISYATHCGAWQWCFIIPGLFALCGAIISFTCLRDTPQSVGLPELEGTQVGKTSAKNKGFLREMVFRNKWIWIFAMANIFVYVLRMGILDWGPKFLTENRGMDIKSAAWSVAAFEILAIVGTIFAGWATDRIFKGKAHRMCLISMIGATVFIAIFAIVPMPTLPSIIFLALGGFCIYGPQALIGIGSANQATKEASATANGLVGFFGYLGSALSAIAVGFIADNYGWNAVFTMFIVMGIIGSIVFFTMWNAPRDGYDKARKFNESNGQQS